nr:MAG: hypothetical protein [Microviridae sp.]
MSDSNAERQSRYRDRVKKRLALLRDVEESNLHLLKTEDFMHCFKLIDETISTLWKLKELYRSIYFRNKGKGVSDVS